MKIEKKKIYTNVKIEAKDFRKYGKDNVYKFIEGIKESIPAAKRNYFPDIDTWAVHNDNANTLTQLISEHITKDKLSLFNHE